MSASSRGDDTGNASSISTDPCPPLLLAGRAFPLLLPFPPRLPVSQVEKAVAVNTLSEPATAEPPASARGKKG